MLKGRLEVYRSHEQRFNGKPPPGAVGESVGGEGASGDESGAERGGGYSGGGSGSKAEGEGGSYCRGQDFYGVAGGNSNDIGLMKINGFSVLVGKHFFFFFVSRF